MKTFLEAVGVTLIAIGLFLLGGASWHLHQEAMRVFFIVMGCAGMFMFSVGISWIVLSTRRAPHG